MGDKFSEQTRFVQNGSQFSQSSNLEMFQSRLTLQSCLGYGSLGPLFKATNVKDKSPTAVKFLFINSQKQYVIRHFPKDLESHENVVKIIDVTIMHFSFDEIRILLPKHLFHSEEQFNRLNFELHSYLDRADVIFFEIELCGKDLRDWITKQTCSLTITSCINKSSSFKTS
ncbi:Cell division protein kinase 2 CRK1 [Folsomia candida]|uniref:Cell division protein kinase 2 CRK1 n=1 Tax=Folsomia candida TaxID=158441 RepID=A0A226DLR4_FOLCA|nr:Cell division protein kinase 2 CRK1 [Folsomia candida]